MNERLPKATHQGVLVIGETELPCFVLDDGRRVISGRGMTKAIGMKGRGQGVQRIPTHKTLKPYITDDLALAIETHIPFLGNSPRVQSPSSGYEATVLVSLCEAILEARDAGVLKTEQENRYAKYCDTLMRAFARVGIIALVDEATGYQYERDRSELHRILEAYISPELLPWTKRFPDNYYENLFRLMKWQYSPPSVKRPKLVGKLTNWLIYEQLPPGVLEKLKEETPKDAKGRRKHKFFQLLTEDIGNPHLEKQIVKVVTLMDISPNWRVFKSFFARAHKTKNTPVQLAFRTSRQGQAEASNIAANVLHDDHQIYRRVRPHLP